jgi:hypothetical protein
MELPQVRFVVLFVVRFVVRRPHKHIWRQHPGLKGITPPVELGDTFTTQFMFEFGGFPPSVT